MFLKNVLNHSLTMADIAYYDTYILSKRKIFMLIKRKISITFDLFNKINKTHLK
jgi:hypothetical protein